MHLEVAYSNLLISLRSSTFSYGLLLYLLNNFLLDLSHTDPFMGPETKKLLLSSSPL